MESIQRTSKGYIREMTKFKHTGLSQNMHLYHHPYYYLLFPCNNLVSMGRFIYSNMLNSLLFTYLLVAFEITSWDILCKNGPYAMYIQFNPRSACPSIQSDLRAILSVVILKRGLHFLSSGQCSPQVRLSGCRSDPKLNPNTA